jgi:hypothetical protein
MKGRRLKEVEPQLGRGVFGAHREWDEEGEVADEEHDEAAHHLLLRGEKRPWPRRCHT